jgi:hypothetical protein
MHDLEKLNSRGSILARRDARDWPLAHLRTAFAPALQLVGCATTQATLNMHAQEEPRTVAPIKTPIQTQISRCWLLGAAVKLKIQTEPLKVPEQPHP